MLPIAENERHKKGQINVSELLHVSALAVISPEGFLMRYKVIA